MSIFDNKSEVFMSIGLIVSLSINTFLIRTFIFSLKTTIHKVDTISDSLEDRCANILNPYTWIWIPVALLALYLFTSRLELSSPNLKWCKSAIGYSILYSLYGAGIVNMTWLLKPIWWHCKPTVFLISSILGISVAHGLKLLVKRLDSKKSSN